MISSFKYISPKSICNSHFDNGVHNGTISILKWGKILVIKMGYTNASWKHLTVAMEPIFFFQFIHLGRFCLRAVKIYNHKNSKILTPILIIGFVMWIFPFRNWHNSDHRNRVYECLWAICIYQPPGTLQKEGS